jgi:tubulin--tyrosine ligase-like protein 12
MSNIQRIKDFDEFAKVHAFLLAASGIPTHLHRRLFAKLASETFDGGDFFSVEPCEGGRQRRLVLSADSLSKESDLFLVDHAWSFRLTDALKQVYLISHTLDYVINFSFGPW